MELINKINNAVIREKLNSNINQESKDVLIYKEFEIPSLVYDVKFRVKGLVYISEDKTIYTMAYYDEDVIIENSHIRKKHRKFVVRKEENNQHLTLFNEIINQILQNKVWEFKE